MIHLPTDVKQTKARMEITGRLIKRKVLQTEFRAMMPARASSADRLQCLA